MSRPANVLLVFVLLACTLFAGPLFVGMGTAWARSTDRNQPMDAESNQNTCTLGDAGQCELTGNVKIIQGSLNIDAAKATIFRAGGDISRALLSGSPVVLNQQMDDGTPMTARASNVDYNLKTDVVVFTGDVQLQQPRGNMSGQRVVYNLKTEGLRKRYRAREVVQDFGLTLDAGEVVGLLGPNGAGKTTCFYMIVGLVPADAGRITLDGRDITAEPMYTRAKLGVGYLPQEPSVFRKLSVADNLRLVLELRPDLDRAGRQRELEGLMDELQVAHVADQSGASLSGGERRRVEIARALAAKPRLMLLDEPFAGVDPISVGEIQRIVRHLKNRGIGVLITDHNVRETLGICDRAYILNEGSVLAQGAPDALLANPDVRRVYLGEAFRL